MPLSLLSSSPQQQIFTFIIWHPSSSSSAILTALPIADLRSKQQTATRNIIIDGKGHHCASSSCGSQLTCYSTLKERSAKPHSSKPATKSKYRSLWRSTCHHSSIQLIVITLTSRILYLEALISSPSRFVLACILPPIQTPHIKFLAYQERK